MHFFPWIRLVPSHEYKLACPNWCYLLLQCFDGKLYLVHWWKMFIVSALSNMGAWNQASRDPKTQPSDKRCLLVHCLAGRCKSQAILTSAWKWSFWAFFCICKGKTSTVCHQWTRWSSPSMKGNCQQWLRQASLYSRHTIMSALYCD